MRLREQCHCYTAGASRFLSHEVSTLYGLGKWSRQPERQNCFHGEVTVRRIFRSTGRLLLENEAGYVRAYDLSELHGDVNDG